MDIILSTGSLHQYPLLEVFRIAKTAGFDGIELLIARGNCNLGSRYIQEISNENDFPILSLHSPFMACDGWGGFWESVWRSLLMAKELSIPLVNFHPPSGYILRHYLNNELSEYVQIYRNMSRDSGITLTIENLPTLRPFRVFLASRFLRRMMNNMYQIAEFIEKNDIHMTFDTTHIGTTGVDLFEAYAVFKNRIANIHLSDYDGRSQHLLPGKGYLPLKELLGQVKSDGYNGVITLETCPAAMEHEDKAKASRNAEAGLGYIKKALQE